jgi:hypothetical protein
LVDKKERRKGEVWPFYSLENQANFRDNHLDLTPPQFLMLHD